MLGYLFVYLLNVFSPSCDTNQAILVPIIYCISTFNERLYLMGRGRVGMEKKEKQM